MKGWVRLEHCFCLQRMHKHILSSCFSL